MSGPIVTVKEGKLQGCILKNYDKEDIVAFRGIPYAEPPVRELRFKAPKPAKPWNGVKDATNYGEPNYAMSFNLDDLTQVPTARGSEDSLTLNVFTKELPQKTEFKLKPVMFWIHGGAFVMGSAHDYNADYLLTEDIVLVTIQYRLGALGFLNFEDPDVGVPGNAGMKDMVLALKWVQNNIKQFGGDPNNVTVFGESAGGAAAHYLMVSPLSKGLIHKVICQSGCVSNSWARGVQNNGMDLAKALGCTFTSPRECLKFLQELPVDKLLEGQIKVSHHLDNPSRQPFFSPTIERESEEDAFLLVDPEELIRSGRYNKLPLITGITSEEGLAFQFSPSSLPANDICVPWYYELERESNEYEEVAQTILRFYFGDKEPSKDSNYFSLLGDIVFNVGIAKQTQLTAANSKEPVYFYRFFERGCFDLLAKISDKFGEKASNLKGLSHGSDIPYFFKFFESNESDSIDEMIVRRFVKMWTNFARTGNPNSVEKNDVLQGLNWKPLKAGNYTYLDIGKELSCREVHPNIKRFKFWEEMDSKYKKVQ